MAEKERNTQAAPLTVLLKTERAPEVDALLAGLKMFDPDKQNYIMGVLDGVSMQIAGAAAPRPTA